MHKVYCAASTRRCFNVVFLIEKRSRRRQGNGDVVSTWSQTLFQYLSINDRTKVDFLTSIYQRNIDVYQRGFTNVESTSINFHVESTSINFIAWNFDSLFNRFCIFIKNAFLLMHFLCARRFQYMFHWQAALSDKLKCLFNKFSVKHTRGT